MSIAVERRSPAVLSWGCSSVCHHVGYIPRDRRRTEHHEEVPKLLLQGLGEVAYRETGKKKFKKIKDLIPYLKSYLTDHQAATTANEGRAEVDRCDNVMRRISILFRSTGC